MVGIDNDMRSRFFGAEASTKKTRDELVASVRSYEHHDLDIRDATAISELFKQQEKIAAVVHTAAQPSHDWAARDPQTDFTVNANGTLNLLEAARSFCPEAPFVFTSTNKVYGDTPNRLPLRELPLRWEIEPGPRIRARYFGNDEHRLHEALALRRIEGGSGYSGAGIRPLLWNADGLFSRRLPNRASARRNRAARFSLLPDDLHRDRTALSGLRLQRQTSARQYSQLRSRGSLRGLHSRSRARAKFITLAEADTATARCSKQSICAKKSAAVA